MYVCIYVLNNTHFKCIDFSSNFNKFTKIANRKLWLWTTYACVSLLLQINESSINFNLFSEFESRTMAKPHKDGLGRDVTDLAMGGVSAMFATLFTNPIEVSIDYND